MSGKCESRMDILEKEGWVKQFVASEPRLSEAVELYKEAGFEVHLEPFPKGRACDSCAGPEKMGEGECRVCFEGVEDLYKIIYTRPSKDFKSSS
ncbi:MAG: hypothetical protein JW836_07655 [Deltaproteobacteria bacterium]|nr:hypothetical protein [Deltaproteobacteria bacterium]